jgi:hypothetical protein
VTHELAELRLALPEGGGDESFEGRRHDLRLVCAAAIT